MWGLIFPGIAIAFIVLVYALPGHKKARPPKLTPEQRADIKQLESDIESIDSRLDILRSCVATSTSQSSIEHWNREITILTERAADYRREIERLKNPAYMPTPATSGCAHESLVPVTTESEPEPVAWMCTSHPCYAELKPGDAAVKRFLSREAKRAARAKADREFAEMWRQPDFAERVREEQQSLRAELASRVLGNESGNEIFNGTDEVFSTGYQPSEWDDRQ